MANEIKIYFYSTDINIKNFTSLKIAFDSYLSKYGEYKFQPFNDKKIFEDQLANNDSILIVSSWHYKNLIKEHNLEALLVAQKKGTITDKKILVGKKNSQLKGLITSAYDVSYTKKLLNELTKKDTDNLPILIVPKDIDALMSVSFHMSDFALVSKDSLESLRLVNPSLTKDLFIFYESEPKYRVLLANNKIQENKSNIITVFNTMSNQKIGKDILEMMGIEKLVILTSKDKHKLGDIK
jgi:hypothetical protein